MKTKAAIYGLGLVFLFVLASFSSARAQIKIMPLGDSITQGSSSGESVQAKQVAYRKALFDQLNMLPDTMWISLVAEIMAQRYLAQWTLRTTKDTLAGRTTKSSTECQVTQIRIIS
jgi:hypothetical protein